VPDLAAAARMLDLGDADDGRVGDEDGPLTDDDDGDRDDDDESGAPKMKTTPSRSPSTNWSA
jgi:hypothetical protein